MNNVKYLIGSEIVNNLPMRPFDDMLCTFTSALSEKLMYDTTAKKYPDVIAFAFWARKGNIIKLKERYKEYTDRLGRGLVFHVTPSNIPVNFAFSYLFALLAGNANIVRIPSKPFLQIQIICNAISETLENFPEIKERTAFVSYPADNETTSSFCLMADSRIIWGGDQTVEHIRGFKTKPRCIDIVFADRYSFCIINGEAIDKVSINDMKHLAEAFYNDTYLMDQNACSSPQLILWQNADAEIKNKFWNAVATLAIQRYDLQPAVAVDKYIQFCEDAIEYDTIKSIQKNQNILYRTIFSSLPDIDLTCLRGQGGYFYEYDLKNIDEIIPFINEKYQTLTYYGIAPETIKEFTIEHRLRGIDRIVPIGSAMDIGLHWDGYDLINVLSRVIAVA
jgi:hypothetical protein